MAHSTIDISSEIKAIVRQQRSFFNTGKTKDLDYRIAQLKALRQAIAEFKPEILAALNADFKKPMFEAYATEVGVLKEIDYFLKHIRTWAKPKKVATPIEQLPGSAWVQPEPLGVVLIIAPWNYPFQLSISPLVAAIAAGNCALVKPSELAPHTSRVVADLIQKTFDPAYVRVIEGGVEVSQSVLAEKFDHIFFTGGTAIGKIVMTAAATHLTPVTLELGGKSPCLVDADIHLTHTARRIVWGKFINAGQTCVAPDYLLVDRRIKADLLQAIKASIREFYGDNPAKSPDFARIISARHFSRLTKLLQEGEIVMGGETDADDRYIAPTVIDRVSLDSPLMQEEIFGPILPVIEYETVEEAIALITSKPKPLALYCFSQNKQIQDKVLRETSSGGVCLNDTIMQLGIPELPFGGVGDSGIGSYHGKTGFDTFSHLKSILHKRFWLDLDWRYPPYASKLATLKKIIG